MSGENESRENLEARMHSAEPLDRDVANDSPLPRKLSLR
jgi:hypothetical protein